MAETSFPIALRVTRYQCPHCRRTWSKSWSASLHIGRCFKNPAAHACKTCALFQPHEREDPYHNDPGCPESCDAGLDITQGLRVHCEQWRAEGG